MRVSRQGHWRLLIAIVAAWGVSSSSGAAQAAKVWFLEAPAATAEGRARLSYGAPETDDIVLRFSCAPASGVLDVLILHTQRRMKRGAPATARLRAGSASWSIRGAIRANDESLDESFAGSAAFNAAWFSRLAAADHLQISVGRAPAQVTPLSGAGETFLRFSALCAKP
jgi:hypothetical protein